MVVLEFMQVAAPLLNWLKATELETFLRNISFLCLFFAMMFYWIETAFNFLTRYKLGQIFMTVSNLALVGLLLLRWNISGHFPLSNLYESLMFLSWSCTMLYFIMLNILGESNSKLKSGELGQKTLLKETNVRVNKDLQKKILGCISSPVALLMNAYATFSLPKEMQQAAPLVPALQSNWLMMHVTVMILSYAALILGSLLSMAFLILSFKTFPSLSLKSALSSEAAKDPIFDGEKISSSAATESGGALTFLAAELVSAAPLPPAPLENKRLVEQNTSSSRTAINAQTKLIENLDNYSYRIIGIGFSLLTIGILSGAVWANEAWGSYWSWDPKETWAFLTWLVYAIYLHTRLTKGWQGEKPAMIASVGFITVWVCFLGVNLIGKGLHSYGFLNS